MAGLGGGVPEEHKVMLFYSDYFFLPEGLRVIKLRFDQLMSNENMYSKVDYKRKDSYFELTCEALDSEIIWKIFQALHNEIIRTEISDGYDFDSKLIAKIAPSKDGTENSDIEPAGIDTADPKENIPLNVQGFWKWVATDESLENVIPQEALLEIAALTGTRLVEDLGNQIIYIYGKSREDCAKVMQKLYVLQKYHYLARRFLHHSFFTEGKTDIEVCMPILSDVHKKLVETTLLDPFYASLKHEDLTKVRTVRCCPYSNIRGAYNMKPGGKIFPAVPEDATGVGLRQWSGYRYPYRGGVPLKQTNVFQDSKIESSEATMNEIENQNTYGLLNFYSGNLIDLVLWTGLADSGKDSEVKILPSTQPANKTDNSPGLTQSRRGIRRSASISDLRKGSLLESKKTLTSDNSTAPQLIFIEDDENSSHRDEIHKSSQGRQSLLDKDITESERRSLTSVELEGPFGLEGLRITKNALLTIEEEKEDDEVNSRVRKGNAGTGITVMPVSTTRVCELRGGAHTCLPVFVAFENVPIESRTKEFVQDIEESAYTILNSVRNYSGNITLKCHFGRLLIKPLSAAVMHSLQRKLTHPADYLKDILQRSPKKVDFTKNVTTLPADVNFIQCMEIEETKQRIWGEVLQESSVTYEFVCCEHQDSEGKCATPFIIQIDADSFATTVRSPMFNFGRVLVHCTLRNWDYVITADGTRNMGERYGDVAHAIKKKMYIGAESKRVSMSFELHRCHRVHFRSIRVRRRTQHRSYDGRTLLNITEVHNLDCRSEVSETGNIFSVTESEEPNSMWYEVDMESVEARIAFKENLSLELADETEWSAEILVQSGVMVKDLCVPANYIVAKIDGVGFHNDNGISLADGSSDIIDPLTLPEEQRPGYHFW